MDYLLSSITSGVWAMQKDAAMGYMGFVSKVLKGETPAAPDDWRERRQSNWPKIFVESNGSLQLEDGAGSTSYNMDLLRNARPGTVAYMNVEGPITLNGQASGAMGTKERVRVLNAIASMDNIAGLVTYFDTPGGAADGLREYFDALQKVSASGKETTALVDTAFSAGYYMAAAHNRILAVNKMSQFGSIGSYITLMDVRGFFESQGIRLEDIYATESTEKNGPYRAWLYGDSAPVQGLVDRYRDDFVDAVKEGRPGANESAFKGAAYFAPEAENLGLFDGYATQEEAVLITIEAAEQSAIAAQNQAKMEATEKVVNAVVSGVTGWAQGILQKGGVQPKSEETEEEPTEEVLPEGEEEKPLESQTEDQPEGGEAVEPEAQKPEGTGEESPESAEAISARAAAIVAENAALKEQVELQERLNAAKAAEAAVEGATVKGGATDKPLVKRPANAEAEGLKNLGERFNRYITTGN